MSSSIDAHDCNAVRSHRLNRFSALLRKTSKSKLSQSDLPKTINAIVERCNWTHLHDRSEKTTDPSSHSHRQRTP